MYIEVDPIDYEDGRLQAWQRWEDGIEQLTDMGEIIIILANRSTIKGRSNEKGYVFSYEAKPLVKERRK